MPRTKKASESNSLDGWSEVFKRETQKSMELEKQRRENARKFVEGVLTVHGLTRRDAPELTVCKVRDLFNGYKTSVITIDEFVGALEEALKGG